MEGGFAVRHTGYDEDGNIAKIPNGKTVVSEIKSAHPFERDTRIQPVEKVQRKLGFFAFMWYNIGEGS